ERRPGAGSALDPERPAHERDEALRDREPEAGPSVPARRRRVDLAEGLEELGDALGRDADPGVAYGEVELVLAGRDRAGRDGDADLSPIGELDGVREQVREDLPEARHVADDRGRDAVVDE